MARDAGISKGRRLIFHMGVQKTGSTSLHHMLHRNRAALSDRLTVLMPEKGSVTRALGRAATRFSLNPDETNRMALVAAARRVRDDVAPGTTPVLISHENLPGAMLGNGSTCRLYPQLEAILSVLIDAFAPMDCEFVLYTRDMADWKHSVYGQAVRSDRYDKSRADFMTETADCGTWDELRRRLVTHLGADRARVFRIEDETDPDRPGGQLLRHVGLSSDDLAALRPQPVRSNPALNAGALEFLRLLNGLGLERPARRRVADLVTAQQSLFVSRPA
ncbi:hypothetical protein I5535_15180 [Rhodobacteraceae bacterium F11138]|nr:hypothetical protein [Rhodobacteraceae bacterium F11138]